MSHSAKVGTDAAEHTFAPVTSSAPVLALPYRSIFSTGRAWGRVAIDAAGIRLFVDGGCLELDRLLVTIAGSTHELHPPPVPAGDAIHLTF